MNLIALLKFFIIPVFTLFAFLIFNTALTVKIYAQSNETQTSDCTRSTPARIVKKAVFPQTTFSLSRDKRTGTETVKFPNGDKLTITNAGCDYYYLSFRFETGRFSARPSDTRYWFKQAVELIKQTEKGIDAPVQMSDVFKALNKHIKTNKSRNSKKKLTTAAMIFERLSR